jgi:hypothetical protein
VIQRSLVICDTKKSRRLTVPLQLHDHAGVLSSLDFVELVHPLFEFVQLPVMHLREHYSH